MAILDFKVCHIEMKHPVYKFLYLPSLTSSLALSIDEIGTSVMKDCKGKQCLAINIETKTPKRL